MRDAGWQSRALVILAGLVVAGVLIGAMFFSQDLECAECKQDSDCRTPQRCRSFTDGQKRCAKDAMQCTDDHVLLPAWSHGVLLGALVVGGLALSHRHTRRKLQG